MNRREKLKLRSKERSRHLPENHWGISVSLADGPLTAQEIQASFEINEAAFAKRFGFFMIRPSSRHGVQNLSGDLFRLQELGLISKEGERYALTEAGRAQAAEMMEKTRASLAWLRRSASSLLEPATASKVGLVCQSVLAACKLPAALLSGSVGLLNDTADTILDLLSSALVFLGIRFNRERDVTFVLVAFMIGTSAFTLFQAIQRLFSPATPNVDWLPFAAAFLSAAVSLVLWVYQRYIGIRRGLLSFITQSIDSRNHLIVAASVAAGLAASALHFGLLDALVGLGVALIISWSAVRLVVELARSSGGEQVDLSRYGFWPRSAYERMKRAQFQDWMLYLIDGKEACTRGELVGYVGRTLDFRGDRWMAALGLDTQLSDNAATEPTLDGLIEAGWVVEGERLCITPEGAEHLRRSLAHHGRRRGERAPLRLRRKG